MSANGLSSGTCHWLSSGPALIGTRPDSFVLFMPAPASQRPAPRPHRALQDAEVSEAGSCRHRGPTTGARRAAAAGGSRAHRPAPAVAEEQQVQHVELVGTGKPAPDLAALADPTCESAMTWVGLSWSLESYCAGQQWLIGQHIASPPSTPRYVRGFFSPVRSAVRAVRRRRLAEPEHKAGAFALYCSGLPMDSDPRHAMCFMTFLADAGRA